ncbi:hypothetical protein ABG953_11610 [Enterococcus faecalis]|uniref:hypothetical protein n=1 Tax=Enterococcus TaxID=1350 RepID=UPI001362BFB5|nr:MULTISPECIES: hypothetical protein [Enterococcus]BDH66073.1 hypothetical protein MTP05_22580 [Enterococcus sp. PLM3]EGO9125981.1 hypothetical protein [Enterococcus faecalis]EIB6793085.1 hypothetical protein [Enterococcus faecalis]MDH5126225.1 hypothetical protein [Enterococcus faecalis]MDQ8650652.1 hypothetical protein [Enterococcus sp. FR042]
MDKIRSFIELNGVITALTGVSILGLVGASFKLIRKNYKALKERDEKLDTLIAQQGEIQKDISELQMQGAKRQKANIASLHDRIYSNYETILSRNPPRITMKELNNLQYLWDAYSGLGGNGTGEKMYNRVCDLPIVDDEGED